MFVRLSLVERAKVVSLAGSLVVALAACTAQPGSVQPGAVRAGSVSPPSSSGVPALSSVGWALDQDKLGSTETLTPESGGAPPAVSAQAVYRMALAHNPSSFERAIAQYGGFSDTGVLASTDGGRSGIPVVVDRPAWVFTFFGECISFSENQPTKPPGSSPPCTSSFHAVVDARTGRFIEAF